MYVLIYYAITNDLNLHTWVIAFYVYLQALMYCSKVGALQNS